MNPEIVIIGAKDRELERLLGAINLRTSQLPSSELATLAHAAAHQPDVVVVDLRGGQALPAAVATLKRQHPTTPVLLVTVDARARDRARGDARRRQRVRRRAAAGSRDRNRGHAPPGPQAAGRDRAGLRLHRRQGRGRHHHRGGQRRDRAGSRRRRPHAARRPAPGARRRRRLPRRRTALLGRRRPRQHPSLRRRLLQGPGRPVAGRPAPAGVVRQAARADQQRAARAQPGRVRGQPLPLHRARRAALRRRRPGRARSGVADRGRRQPGAGDGAQRQPDRGGAAPALRQRHASR